MSELTQHCTFSTADKHLIARAIKTVEKQYMAAENAPAFISPALVHDYLRLKLQDHDREHFLVLFLNNQNRLIAAEALFSGTINQVEVHTRIIARKALLHNAAAVILAHNHPSGILSPSNADELITHKIIQSLDLLDIRVLDHFITGPGSGYWSFAEHGMII